jgi:hypothetical protein
MLYDSCQLEPAVCMCATALVTGVVDTRPLAPRCALRWGYEAPDSRRSSRLLRGHRWLSLRARAIELLYSDLWGLTRMWLHPRVCELWYPRLTIPFGNETALSHYG